MHQPATLTSLGMADEVVVVGACDPVGLQRLVRGLQELGTVRSGRPTVVVNRVRTGAVGAHPETRVAEALGRFAGVEDVVFVPDDRVSLEWLDGYIAALLAGPRRIEADEWLPVFAEGVFARTFADPADAESARAAIDARWRVLADQLDPEKLLDDPDVLRLAPLMIELTDEDKQRLVDEGHVKPDEIALLEQTGATVSAINLDSGGARVSAVCSSMYAIAWSRVHSFAWIPGSTTSRVARHIS